MYLFDNIILQNYRTDQFERGYLENTYPHFPKRVYGSYKWGFN